VVAPFMHNLVIEDMSCFPNVIISYLEMNEKLETICSC
jgi:hypothetical protein